MAFSHRSVLHGSSQALLLKTCLAGLLIVLSLGLGQTDAVHEVANTALGDDVRDGVANLNGDHGGCRETSLAIGGALEHWLDVHNGVCAPGEDSCPACPLDSILASLRLCLLGLLEANEEGVHDVAERKHGEEPEARAGARLSSGLTRVSVSNHECGGHSECAASLEGLLLRKAHHEDNLDKEQRHGKEPVDIAVCIVERNASRRV